MATIIGTTITDMAAIIKNSQLGDKEPKIHLVFQKILSQQITNDVPRITENGKLVYSEKSDTLYIRNLKRRYKGNGEVIQVL